KLCGVFPPEDPKRSAALGDSFEGGSLAATNAALVARLKQNNADRAIRAPLLIAQGLADVIVLPAATDAYVKERCTAGQQLEYWTFPTRDHRDIVRPGTPLDEPLVAWTAARFANEPQAKGCTRKEETSPREASSWTLEYSLTGGTGGLDLHL